ncbi:hypothetical protein ACNKHU_15465 [Shigella flexneri]
MLKREMNIADYDAELWQAMEQEKVRQRNSISQPIASENYNQPACNAGAGFSADQEYAKGYPVMLLRRLRVC